MDGPAGGVSKTMKAKAEAMPEFGRVPVHYLPYGVPLPESSDATVALKNRCAFCIWAACGMCKSGSACSRSL